MRVVCGSTVDTIFANRNLTPRMFMTRFGRYIRIQRDGVVWDMFCDTIKNMAMPP